MTELISPFDDRVREAVEPAPRLSTLQGATVGLLDIAKPKGEQFLDRLETLLRERHGVADVVRLRKPTHTAPAPDEVLSQAMRCGAVVEALAD